MYTTAAQGLEEKSGEQSGYKMPESQEVQAGATSKNCTTTYTTNPRRPILG